jgi:hypothetical protein
VRCAAAFFSSSGNSSFQEDDETVIRMKIDFQGAFASAPVWDNSPLWPAENRIAARRGLDLSKRQPRVKALRIRPLTEQ